MLHRRVRIASTFLVAAGAWLLWDTVVGRGSSPEKSTLDRVVSALAVAGEPLEVYTRPPPRDFAVRAVARAAEDVEPRLRGKVADEGGVAVAGARVYALVPATSHVLGWVESSAEGTYSLDLPIRMGSYSIDVAACAAGFATFMCEGVVLGSDSRCLDIFLSRGLVIEGRLLERATGSPLGGVRLVASSNPAHRHRGEDPYLSSFMFRDGRGSTFDRSFHEVSTCTDGSGAFRLEGLPGGSYSIVSGTLGWLVCPSIDVPGGSRGIMVLAVPAVCLRVTVQTAPGQARPALGIDRFGVFVIYESGFGEDRRSFFASGANGEATLAWRVMRPGERDRLNVEIDVPGHAVVYESSEWDTVHEPTRHIVAQVRPVELRDLRVHAAYEDGGAIDGDLLVSTTPADSHALFGPVVARRDADGTFTCRVPDEAMFVHVRLAGPLQAGNMWIGEIPKSTGAAVSVHAVRLKRGGTVGIHVSGPPDGLGALGFVSRALSSRVELTRQETTFRHVPVGEWLVLWHGPERRQESRRLTVTAGGQVDLRF